MTQEDKDLLIKDLCSRLPYGVKVKFKVNEVIEIKEKFIYNIDGEYSYITDGKSYLTLDIIKLLFNNHLDEIKPYLFPMSSMTEEQKRKYNSLCDEVPTYHYEYGDVVEDMQLCDNCGSIDYLIANHFDYRGLIPKGLANDATNLNIY